MDRAVIYCRVSTDEEVQVNALVGQVKEARLAAEKNSWVLVGEYIDEGKSGTTTKHRDEYNRLVEDLQTDKFNIIVVKSQDRLMRNTREWYIFVDKLVQSGKKLYFYLENKFYTTDDALITGIKAILAEEYSRDLSKKINNAHKHRQRSGSNVSITSNTWGYDKDGKNVVINEAEAEIVRFIYSLASEGAGCRTISKELEKRGYKNRQNGHFYEASIRRIIRNPLYKGTVIMNQRHFDFNTKKTIHVPEEEWIVHKDLLPAIVDDELWEKANDSLNERSIQGNGGKRKGVNPGKHELSSKIVCAECGSTFWRRYRKNKRGEQIADWSCSEYLSRGRLTNNTKRGRDKIKLKSAGGCDNIHLKEDLLMEKLSEIAKAMFMGNADEIVNAAMKILEEVIEEGDGDELKELKNKKEAVMAKREKLLDKALEGLISDELFKRKDRSLETEYNEITSKISSLEANIAEKEQKTKRFMVLREEVIHITDKNIPMQKLMEQIEKLIVYRDHIEVQFAVFDSVNITVENSGKKNTKMSVCYRRSSNLTG